MVFKVKARDNGFSAAIKCIRKNVVNTERELSRVKSEFSCWRAMSEHPHVISLFAFLETDRHWCFVMEREDFGSLSQILRNEGKFTNFSTTPRYGHDLARIECRV